MTTPATPPPGLGRLRRWLPWLLLGVALLRLFLGAALFYTAPGERDRDRLVALAGRLAANDAIAYYSDAHHILKFFADGLTSDLPPEMNLQRFALLLAPLYNLEEKDDYLHVVGFYALLALGLGWLAYGLARRLGQGPERAAGLALLLTLWPPGLVWASLPLKEVPALLAALAHLYCLCRLLDREKRDRTPAAAALGYLASGLLLAFLRFYLGYFVVLLGLAALAASFLSGREAAPSGWGRRGLLLGLILLTFLLGRPLHRDTAIYFEAGNPWPLLRSEGPLMVEPPAKPLPQPSETSPPAPPLALNPSADQMVETKPGQYALVNPGWWDRVRNYRMRFVDEAGRSLSPGALEAGPLEALVLGLRDLLFFPTPWQRWPETPHWTLVNLAVAGTALVWWLLLPGIAAGAWSLARRRPGPVLTLLAWGLGLGLALAVVVVNRGTLFRLREIFLLPGLLLWDPAPYLWLWRRLRPGRPESWPVEGS